MTPHRRSQQGCLHAAQTMQGTWYGKVQLTWQGAFQL